MSSTLASRVVGAAAAVVLALGLLTAAFELGAKSRSGDPLALSIGSDAEGLRAIEDVFERIGSQAVDSPEQEILVEGAIEGMLEALGDDYAVYYTADEYAALNQQLDGRFVGIGIVLEDTEVGLTIQTVIPGSPAEEAGLEPGEEIVTVDGTDVRQTPSDVVVEQVRGEAGSDVVLGLEAGSGGPREVTVTRAEIDLPNIEARVLDDKAGYVRLQQFTGDSGDLVEAAVADVLAQGADGIVLDLRGNPGGLLNSAVEVTNVFVAEGQEVVSVGSDPETAREELTDEPAITDVPLVVLVDQGSASASEIVAGALQDLDRAEVVGETTFGKGTVQTISALSDGQGLKFTTARYYTPSGDSIEGVGVAPDQVVQAVEGEQDVQLSAAQETLAEELSASVR